MKIVLSLLLFLFVQIGVNSLGNIGSITNSKHILRVVENKTDKTYYLLCITRFSWDEWNYIRCDYIWEKYDYEDEVVGLRKQQVNKSVHELGYNFLYPIVETKNDDAWSNLKLSVTKGLHWTKCFAKTLEFRDLPQIKLTDTSCRGKYTVMGTIHIPHGNTHIKEMKPSQI